MNGSSLRLSKLQCGTVALELAFLLIFLLLVAAGIFGFGRAFWYYNALAKATRDGARAMSVASQDAVLSGAAMGAAQNLVVAEANGAGISPPLSTGNVSVTCSSACSTSIPSDLMIEVRITGYTIDIGGLFPFIAPDGTVSRYLNTPLSPYTTMRYMN